MFEKIKIDQKGEAGFRIWRESLDKDPQTKHIIPYF